jgi:hypothetical protein
MKEYPKDNMRVVEGQVLLINLGFSLTVSAKPAPTSANG